MSFLFYITRVITLIKSSFLSFSLDACHRIDILEILSLPEF